MYFEKNLRHRITRETYSRQSGQGRFLWEVWDLNNEKDPAIVGNF